MPTNIEQYKQQIESTLVGLSKCHEYLTNRLKEKYKLSDSELNTSEEYIAMNFYVSFVTSILHQQKQTQFMDPNEITKNMEIIKKLDDSITKFLSSIPTQQATQEAAVKQNAAESADAAEPAPRKPGISRS